MRLPFPWLLCVAVWLSACECGVAPLADDAGEPPGEVEAGLVDAGVLADAGQFDGGVEPDGGAVDSGVDDAGVAADAGADAGEPDGGAERDAGAPDAGDDAGVPVDAGLAEEFLPDAGWSIPREGLFGGPVHWSRRAPSQPARVYAVTLGERFFVSEDHGTSWSERAPILAWRAREPGSFIGTELRAFEVSPVDANELWAIAVEQLQGVTTVTLVRTLDGGRTWARLTPPHQQVSRLAVGPGVVWAAGRASSSSSVAFRSIDGGATFTSLTVPSGLAGAGFSVLAHPTDPLAAWFWSGDRVFRTLDGGGSWVEQTPPLASGEYVRALTASPADPARLWLSVASGRPFRSVNSGASWSRSSAPPSVECQPSLLSASAVWCARGASALLVVSVDDGATWDTRAIPLPLLNLGDPSFAPLDAQRAVWTGAELEVRTTLDSGQTWARSVNGITAVVGASVAIASSGTMVLGTEHGQLFRSVDQGRSWTLAGQGLPALPIVALAFDAASPGVLYASTGETTAGGLFPGAGVSHAVLKSLDEGRTFSVVTPPPMLPVRELYVVDSTVTAATSSAVTRSTNGGATWTSPAGFALNDVSRVPGSATQVQWLGGALGSVWVTTDATQTNQELLDPSNLISLSRVQRRASSRTQAGVHYAASDLAFGRWDNGWSLAQVGLVRATDDFGNVLPLLDLEVAAAGTQDVLLATSATAVHRSGDGAATWQNWSPPWWTSGKCVLADRGATALVALRGRGVLLTRTGGQ